MTEQDTEMIELEETDFVGMEQLEFVDFKQKYVSTLHKLSKEILNVFFHLGFWKRKNCSRIAIFHLMMHPSRKLRD